MFLNYNNNLGLNYRSFINTGVICSDTKEFFEEIIAENDATISIIGSDIDSMIDALNDGEFLESIDMEQLIAECLRADLIHIKNNERIKNEL